MFIWTVTTLGTSVVAFLLGSAGKILKKIWNVRIGGQLLLC